VSNVLPVFHWKINNFLNELIREIELVA
jgi:hypothetical protein